MGGGDLVPVDEVAEPGVVGPDEAALAAEREAVGAAEAEEVGGDGGDLPQHHLSAAAAEGRGFLRRRRRADLAIRGRGSI